ncbi:MAG: chemotaxis response regulator protein-glutamate methylesterase [Alphaproteobacteria bacterium]
MNNGTGVKTDGPENPPNEPFNVLLVDDSAVVRGMLCRILECDPGIKVVATVANGEMAIKALARHPVDVVVLDIEMPVMDGLTALPKLIEVDPNVKVIMASTLTMRNADISLKALQLGAADYVAKPTAAGVIASGYDFRHEFLSKVKALGAARRRGKGFAGPTTEAGAGRATRGAQPAKARKAHKSAEISLRRALVPVPEVVAIGSSTGGPQALFTLFPGLVEKITQPILLTQHMPVTFTTILAEHIGKVCGRPCAEAVNGESILEGRIYVAPGNYHMMVEEADGKRIRLSQHPPENFCRPSVDPMLRSLARVYGRRVLSVILTGMGQDGLKGGEAVTEAGGAVIAQDEETSVVWGMPGAVAMAGLCSAVLPLDSIVPYVSKIVMRPAA